MARCAIILHDDRQVGRALRVLMAEQGFDVIREEESAEATILAVATVHPDVAVIDLDLSGTRGIRLVSSLLEIAPRCRVLVLSSFDRIRFGALRAGAYAVFGKADLRDFRECLAQIDTGDSGSD